MKQRVLGTGVAAAGGGVCAGVAPDESVGRRQHGMQRLPIHRGVCAARSCLRAGVFGFFGVFSHSLPKLFWLVGLGDRSGWFSHVGDHLKGVGSLNLDLKFGMVNWEDSEW